MADDGALWLNGQHVNLSPLQRRLLLALVEHAGRLLTREQLALSVWGHDRVSAISLARTVHGLRRVFDGGPLGAGVIKTSYGLGYGLCVPVERQTNHDAELLAPLQPQSSLLVHYVEGCHRLRYGTVGQLHRAASHLRQACALDPNHGPSLMLLVQVLLSLHRAGMPWLPVATEVDQLLQRLQQLSPVPAGLVLLRATALSLLHRQPAQATALAGQRAIQIGEPGPLELLWTDHLLSVGDQPAAQRLVLALSQAQVAGVEFQQARLAAQTHDVDGCLRWLDVQISAEPAYVPAYRYKAMVMADADAPAAAMAIYWSAMALADVGHGPDPCHAYLLAMAGDRQASAAQVRCSLDGSPSLGVWPWSHWALAAAAAGDRTSCELLVDRAIEQRCGAAALLVRDPFLDRWMSCPAVARLREAMTAAPVERPPMPGAQGVNPQSAP
ncbi:MAG: winged helix-turn-helix domain-containing protein [Cyanobacteriota bacterium]|nr:winged helix-turn-helix domain-containing protein [Cyanobacteriota bacterium]